MSDRWGSIYSDRKGEPDIAAGRYHIQVSHETYGQGDYGMEHVIRLDNGPCEAEFCDRQHVNVT